MKIKELKEILKDVNDDLTVKVARHPDYTFSTADDMLPYIIESSTAPGIALISSRGWEELALQVTE